MNVLFGTVVYNAAYQYYIEFIQSLNAQTTLDYKLLIINDDLSEYQLDSLKELCCMKVIVIQSPSDLTIAELRSYMILKAKEIECDLLILGDFDDTFNPNRVESIIHNYRMDIGFYYHQLKKISGENIFLNLPQEIDDYKQILEYNFLGLSNTAINLRLLDTAFIKSLFEYKGQIFDWYLYTRLLLNEKKGILVPNAYTCYRIHDNNIAGINNKDFIKEKKIKIAHYKSLENYNAVFNNIRSKYEQITASNFEQYYKPNNSGFWWNNLKVKE